MIVNEYIEIIGNSKNIEYYRNKGYEISRGDKIKIKTTDLSNGSTFKVLIECCNCHIQKEQPWGDYYRYTKGNNQPYYCKDCNYIKRINTNMKRYGGKSPTSSREVVLKIKNTNNKRYGNNSSLHGKNQEKTDQIFLEKYGFISPSKNDIVKEKIRNTNLERYDSESPLQNEDIKLKLIKTNLERYGVSNVSQLNDIKNKIIQNNLLKYNKEHFFQTDKFKVKRDNTIRDKYGVDNYFNSLHREKHIINQKKINYPDLDIIEYENRIFTIRCDRCESNYKIETDLLYKRYKNNNIVCTNCNSKYDKFRSSGEIEICFLLDDNGIKYQTSVRDIIKGRELDIYLPDYNIAIEYNGMFWHSEYFKERGYHKQKNDMCQEANINLLQIWENDWNDQRDKMEDFILNKLGIFKKRIYARKCRIGFPSKEEKKSFLDANHIQNNANSSIEIGLYYGNELVSLMTFGKRRLNSKEALELVRFCNKRNYIIIGGASKIFKYFIRNYNFSTIVSYSDNDISNGDIYNILKFEYNGENLNYYWSDGKNRYHRFRFNKQRLIKEGYDPNKTENEIMKERGYYRIYGSGIKTWVYYKK